MSAHKFTVSLKSFLIDSFMCMQAITKASYSHLGIGDGNVDWVKVVESLKRIKFSGVIVVESEWKVEEGIQELIGILKNT